MTHPVPIADQGRKLLVVISAMSLAFLLGSIFAVGAIVAPLVFRELMLSQSAPLMILIFKRLDLILFGCALVNFVCFLGKLALRPQWWLSKLEPVRLLLSIALVGMVAISAFYIHPQIATLQEHKVHRGGTSDESKRFDDLHALAESLYKADLVVGSVLMILIVL